MRQTAGQRPVSCGVLNGEFHCPLSGQSYNPQRIVSIPVLAKSAKAFIRRLDNIIHEPIRSTPQNRRCH